MAFASFVQTIIYSGPKKYSQPPVLANTVYSLTNPFLMKLSVILLLQYFDITLSIENVRSALFIFNISNKRKMSKYFTFTYKNYTPNSWLRI